jgi:hypothetical protein
VLGELVQTTTGKWITHPPTGCPNGHTLGPNQVLVGHQACLGHGGGHTTWTCRTCDAVVYGPVPQHSLHDVGGARYIADLQRNLDACISTNCKDHVHHVRKRENESDPPP